MEHRSSVDAMQDKSIKVNWGTFNVPTIAGMLAVFAAVYSLGGELARNNERISSIEVSRASTNASVQAAIAELRNENAQTAALVPTLTYRVTVAEQGIVAANQRMDRFSDVVGDLRNDIAKTTTAIEVLSQKLDVAFDKNGLPSNGK